MIETVMNSMIKMKPYGAIAAEPNQAPANPGEDGLLAGIGSGKTKVEISAVNARPAYAPREVPVGCAACFNRRPGRFCSLSSAVRAELDLTVGTIQLPARRLLFAQGAKSGYLYLIRSGYFKLSAGPHASQPDDRPPIMRVAGPGSILGLYAALTRGVYEVSAESLTRARLQPIECERFLAFLCSHQEAQMRAIQCVCQEYRFALQDACRIASSETVGARLRRLLLELAQQIGEHTDKGEIRFPLVLTHGVMASMTRTTRETVARTLGQLRREGAISIEDNLLTIHNPEQLQILA